MFGLTAYNGIEERMEWMEWSLAEMNRNVFFIIWRNGTRNKLVHSISYTPGGIKIERLDGMNSIKFHSAASIICKPKEWNSII